jgi:hypothetical protein
MSLCLNKSHDIKTYWGGEVQLQALSSEIDGDEWSASRLGRFNPLTHWIGGWEGSRAGMDAVAKRKISFIASAGNGNPIVRPVALSV